MAVLQADQLDALARRILCGADVSTDDASVVAVELREANLVGHDSHGVMRLVQYVDYMKSSRRMPGVDEILMPGEIELRRLEERRRSGVPIPEETWRQLRELAGRLGVSVEGI